MDGGREGGMEGVEVEGGGGIHMLVVLVGWLVGWLVGGFELGSRQDDTTYLHSSRYRSAGFFFQSSLPTLSLSRVQCVVLACFSLTRIRFVEGFKDAHHIGPLPALAPFIPSPNIPPAIAATLRLHMPTDKSKFSPVMEMSPSSRLTCTCACLGSSPYLLQLIHPGRLS